jgi:hypothetical protein
MLSLIAQQVCFPSDNGQQTCVNGPIPTGTFSNSGGFTLADVVSRLMLFIFPIAGLILFLNIMWSGFSYLTSAGDPKKMEMAKGRLTTSLIGFIILFLAFWITQLVAFILGIKGVFNP